MSTPSAQRRYLAIAFDRTVEAAAFVAALSRFLNSPQGSTYMAQPEPVEVWSHTAATGEGLAVYLSASALVAVTAVFAPLPVTETRLAPALPAGCVLLIGSDHTPSWGLVDVQGRLP